MFNIIESEAISPNNFLFLNLNDLPIAEKEPGEITNITSEFVGDQLVVTAHYKPAKYVPNPNYKGTAKLITNVKM